MRSALRFASRVLRFPAAALRYTRSPPGTGWHPCRPVQGPALHRTEIDGQGTQPGVPRPWTGAGERFDTSALPGENRRPPHIIAPARIWPAARASVRHRRTSPRCWVAVHCSAVRLALAAVMTCPPVRCAPRKSRKPQKPCLCRSDGWWPVLHEKPHKPQNCPPPDSVVSVEYRGAPRRHVFGQVTAPDRGFCGFRGFCGTGQGARGSRETAAVPGRTAPARVPSGCTRGR